LLVILGWHGRLQKFAVTPDASQDLFAGHNINRRSGEERPRFRADSHGAEKYRSMAQTLLFDGAILIDRHGNVLHSGVMIEGLRPRQVAAKLNPGNFSDLSAQFGFKEKVHTRHLTAITASHEFKDTTVFTVSEESGTIHIFENGKIVYASQSPSHQGTKARP
jgi:hypothetical protein